MMPEVVSTDMKKRRAAMTKRLKDLGRDNPVVEKALENQEPKDHYADFEPVHELVSAAYAKYEESGHLKDCLVDLGSAITKLGHKSKNGKMSGHGEDDGY